MSIFLDRTKELFLKKNLWPLLKKHCPWRALTFLQMIGHLCLCLLTAVEFSDQALLQIFGQKYICVLRAKGGGGEAASSPDELTGNRTRESPTVPAGDHSPEEQTLSAGERNGWSRSVSYYFYVNHKYIHLLSGTITHSIVKKKKRFFFLNLQIMVVGLDLTYLCIIWLRVFPRTLRTFPSLPNPCVILGVRRNFFTCAFIQTISIGPQFINYINYIFLWQVWWTVYF